MAKSTNSPVRPAWNNLKFYGLKPMQLGDWTFPRNCPVGEQSGCLAYEWHRQLSARMLAGFVKPNPSEQLNLSAIREVWMKEWSNPWSLLNKKRKKYWISRSKRRARSTRLKLMPLGADTRLIPGSVYQIIIDWDLGDKEIKRRAERIVEDRPKNKPPRTKTNESFFEVASAIVAQRMTDNKPAAVELEDVVSFWIEKSEFAKLNPFFRSTKRLQLACVRYGKQEDDFELIADCDGCFGLFLKPPNQVQDV